MAERLTSGKFMGLNITPRALSYDYKSPPNPTMGDIVSTLSKGDLSFHQDFTRARQGFAGSLGLRLSTQWRVEGEISYTASGMGTGGNGVGERESRLALMNIYYNIDVGSSKFKPFLTLGTGIITHDIYRGGMNGLGIASETLSGMAWQAGAGLNYQVNDDLSLSGGYRHIGGPGISGDGYNIEPDGHEIHIGLKYQFPKPKAAPYNLDQNQGQD